jgi:hypothetical protein
MATTARISNIESTTTREDLAIFIQSKGLSLAPGQPLFLTATQDGYKIATITFADHATFKRALDLPFADRELNNRCINIDDDFDGITVLSEGSEVEYAFRTWFANIPVYN